MTDTPTPELVTEAREYLRPFDLTTDDRDFVTVHMATFAAQVSARERDAAVKAVTAVTEEAIERLDWILAACEIDRDAFNELRGLRTSFVNFAAEIAPTEGEK